MKKLILFELIFIFLATTFISDNPPGWYQQILPVNDQINDIFFLDSLTGWVVTNGQTNTNDTAYIVKTTDGGSNWIIQYSQPMKLNVIQFTDANIGYAAGGSGSGTSKIYKTTNGGSNWVLILDGLLSISFDDLQFINKDTGWVSSSSFTFGGLWKTTDGAQNWTMELDQTYRPYRMSFINKDTGWVVGNSSVYPLLRTTNGGANWNQIYSSNSTIESIFFINSDNGWMRGGTGNGVIYTTNGGFNWINSQGNTAAGFDLRFVNDSIGYSGMQSFRIPKSTDGGKTWGYQNSPIQNNMFVYMFKNDTLHGWAGGTGLVKTDDGGGAIIYIGIKSSSTFATAFELKQNYPNPFNPSTNISFEIKKNSKVSLKIFNIKGAEVDELIDYEKYQIGTYTINYEADEDLSSGIYFYQLTAWTEDNKEIFIDTRKMILLK